MERLAMALGMGQKDSRLGGGDSFVDRLSCSYTVFVLGIFAVSVTANQWLGEVPISCWCPAHFTDSHKDFTNKVSQVCNQQTSLRIKTKRRLLLYVKITSNQTVSKESKSPNSEI